MLIIWIFLNNMSLSEKLTLNEIRTKQVGDVLVNCHFAAIFQYCGNFVMTRLHKFAYIVSIHRYILVYT